MITFTPLSGGATSSRSTPLAYLLQVDDVHILLDCGSPDWCLENFSSSSTNTAIPWEAYCNALKECASSIDLVLLSHGDMAHSGLYAYAFSRWGLKAPTYATLPVQAMARISALEESECIRAQEAIDIEGVMEEDLALASNDGRIQKYVASQKEVHEAFDAVNTLRYSQPAHLQGKCQGLTITAFNAGHTLGGTMWKIRSPSSGTILYAVDVNHLRERHLDGTVLLKGSGGGGVYETLARPDLFITDAERVLTLSCRRKDRDAQLIDTVTSTLSARHSVLIPCDAGPRLLELLVLLDQHWSYSRLKYPICLISRTGREMLTFVRSMMEWLGGTISKEDVGEEAGKSHNNRRRRDDENEDEALGAFALRFKHLEFFPTPQQLLNTYSTKDPKLILAVPTSLSHGPSRILFSEFASVPDNVVLLTNLSEEGTLGRQLFDMWNGQQREDDRWQNGRLGRNIMLDGAVNLHMKSKIPLQGAELENHLRHVRAAKEKEAAEEAAMALTQRMLEADEDESETDDSEDEDMVERSLHDTMDTSGDGDQNVFVFAEPGAGRSRRRGRANADMSDWAMETEDGNTKQIISYDIYLKGNVAKTSSFFKSENAQTQRFRMFPYIERKRRVDSYGEVIDVGMWLRKGKALEEDAESAESKELKRIKELEEEKKKQPEEPPSKFITLDIDVQLACRLLFVDMEGLNDGRAVKKIAAHVNPRKMVIVHSSKEASTALIEACGAVRALTKDIHAPSVGEKVQIGQHTNSYSISLSEALLSSLKMSSFEDNEVAFVTGNIASVASLTVPVLEPLNATRKEIEDGSEEVVDHTPRKLGHRPVTRLPQSTMIGDLKLTLLKSRLLSVGVHSEFVGEGVLLCRSKDSRSESDPNVVTVRKGSDGKVELEGTASDIYYRVRREIYGMYALVAA